MEKKIVSSWFNGKCLPENYIIPPEKRPGELCVPTCEIPIIDLSKAKGNEREIIIDQIMEACKKFGFFQVLFIYLYFFSCFSFKNEYIVECF